MKVWLALGQPDAGRDKVLEDGRIRIHSHLNRKDMADAMQRAKYIICRSGYSTVMELLALQALGIAGPDTGTDGTGVPGGILRTRRAL
ncbi:MAG: glycosyltransferase [Candidatus Marinimicrobia bacterium]|nr:glycosyltransferase [Candidatus Neomarinimicrobiota bacterium]